jgi:phosphate-selective porin OprO/OprP
MRHVSVPPPGLVGTAMLLALLAQAAQAQQDSTAPTLEERVAELDQRIRVLDRLRELQADSLATARRSQVAVSAGQSGFSIRSADGAYQLRIRGYFHADARTYFGDEAKTLTTDFLIRRARPVIEATVARYYSLRIMPDFGGSAPTVFDAYFEAQWVPQFGVRAGKFKPPVGLERLQSATDMKFVERGFPTNLVPNRDVGLQVQGALGLGVLEYQAGIFAGTPDLGSGNGDVADGKELAARLFLVPFAKSAGKGPVDLGIGIAATTSDEEGSTAATSLPSYRSPAQATAFRYRSSSATPVTGTVFADGRRTRIAPQAYLNRGPFGLLAEYTVVRQSVARDTGVSRTNDRLSHRAWQVSGSWFLTGETNSFKTVTPKQGFDPKGPGRGAFELVARYGQIEFDEDAFPRYADPTASVEKAKAWAVGVNWHFTRNVKFGINYEQTSFEGGAASGDRPGEKVVFTRFQTAF